MIQVSLGLVLSFLIASPLFAAGYQGSELAEMSDSARVMHWLDLAYDQSRLNLDSAFGYLERADSQAVASDLQGMRPEIDYHYAILYRNQGSFDQAILYTDAYLSSVRESGDSLAMRRGFNLETTIYYELHDYEATLQSALNLKELSESIKDTAGQISGLSFMALVMSDRNEPDKAIEHFHQAIELATEIGDSMRLANMYNNLASAYLKKFDYDNAIKYYELTKSMDEQADYTWGIFNSLHNIGNVYLYKQDFQSARENLSEAFELQMSIGSKQELAMTEYKLGYALVETGSVNEGYTMMKNALQVAEDERYFEIQLQTLMYLSRAYEGQGDFQNALVYHKSYKTIADTLFLQELKAKTSELQIRYETAEKEAEIATLNAANEINLLQIQEGNRRRAMLIGGLVFTLLVAGLLYRLSRIRRSANAALEKKNAVIAKNLTEKETLLREIHHRVKNNLQIISSLLNLQSRNVKDEAARDAMREGQNRVRSMALLHQNLYQEEDLIGVDARIYIEKLTQNLWNSYNIDRDLIRLDTDIDQCKLDVDVMIPLGLIINELVSNALKHAFPEGKRGKIMVSLKENPSGLSLSVEDNGKGLPVDFEEKQKQSMGVKIVHAFARKLHTSLKVYREDGTRFSLFIPGQDAA